MKKSALKFIFCSKILGVLSIAVLLSMTIESYSFSGSQINYQQTNKPKKKKKRVVKKVVTQEKFTAIAPGVWGAEGILVTIEGNGVQIEYECAAGEIKQKFMIDQNGNFNLTGYYKQLSPGPIRVDMPPKLQAANYRGKISGKTMTLKITLTETKEVVGEYSLERDKEVRLRRCR